MKADKINGLVLGGSLKRAGVTFYLRNGKVVARVAHSDERRSNTRGQFVARQRMRHTTALWQAIRDCDPMFSGGKSTYACFASLANSLPVVYVPNNSPETGASFLMPGMPLSDGTLPSIELKIGSVEGMPALITDLKSSAVGRGERLRLYTLEQALSVGRPVLRMRYRDLLPGDFREVDGCLALIDDRFDDQMHGWGIVRIDGDRCSSQVAVTNCSYYVRFTTEEALLAAAETYGGLTD